METNLVGLTCDDTRDGFTCAHLRHHKGDHAETRWVSNIPYTVAFWGYGDGITGLDRVVVVGRG